MCVAASDCSLAREKDVAAQRASVNPHKAQHPTPAEPRAHVSHPYLSHSKPSGESRLHQRFLEIEQ